MRASAARVVVVVMMRVLVAARAVLVLRVVVVVLVVVLVSLVIGMVVVVLVTAVSHAKLGRADAGAVDALAPDGHPVEAERRHYPLQLVEGRTRVEQRSQEHVAGNAGKAVEVQDLRHGEVPTAARFP